MLNRRSFFGRVAALLGAFSVFSWTGLASAERRRGGGGAAAGNAGAGGAVKMVDPKAPQAKAVNYVLKHSEITNAALKADRQGVKFEQQNCENCSFFSKARQHNGENIGDCQIFPGQQVKADAWCASWNKKV